MRLLASLAPLSVVLWVSYIGLADADASKLVCPLDIPAATLTMACGAACPNALSPCLYYAAASDCVAEGDSGSVCISSEVPKSNCAVECFSPFGNDSNGSGDWNLMVTTEGEYKRDVIDLRMHKPAFPLAKKPLTQLASIRDLRFPATAKTIAISGNALPIMDKAVDYPVIYNGFSVGVDMGNFSFLANAQSATTIIFENINITALTAFPLLPQLTTLQLSNGKLRSIPTGIAALPALQRLEVSLTTLISIADGLLPMTLVDLCLQDSGLEQLPPSIASMTNLKKLDLAGNKFPLPAAGSLPLQVEHLIWWGFYHKLLPPDFSKMTKLKKLEMGWNDFSESSALKLLPPSLEELHLIDVSLSDLPFSFTTLKNLMWIELGKNNIKRVASKTLPPNLTFLNLSVNFISEIDAGAFPTSLKTLDLRFNKLTCSSFPADISVLPSLQALYLHENNLDCIPPAIFQFTKLETLTLQQNGNLSRITFNPVEVAFLSQLKRFQIDQQSLETECEQPTRIGAFNYTVCLTGDATIHSNSTDTGRDGSSGSSSITWLIIGLAGAIGGLIVILIGAVHWKRRRDNANNVMPHPYTDDGKAGVRPFAVTELYAMEAHLREGDGASDVTAYAEMSHAEALIAKSTAKAMGTQSISSSFSETLKGSESHRSATKTTKKTTTTTTTITTTSASGESHVDSSSTVSTVVGRSSGETSTRFSVWDDEELLQWRIDYAAIRDVQLLSSGMHGEVWLAIYMSRHVAVKRMKKKYNSERGGAPTTGDDESSESARAHRHTIQQFVQELKLHSRLDHPKIVRFIGVAWTMESDLEGVVEYMAMGDLQSFLSSLQPRFETLHDDIEDEESEHHWDATALEIAIDMAEALVYLHSLDPPMLHRDLKSRNILLDEGLHAKVTDFGISRYHFDDDTHIHLTTNLSTARWAAPEILSGSDANYTSAVDVYSLGIILSELDTWAVPFSEHVGVADSALLTQMMEGELLPRFRSSSPQEIIALAKQCLSIDPVQRPTAVEVAYRLRQCLVTCQSSEQHVYGLAAASRGSMSSSRASLTAVGPAVAMLL